MPVVSAPPVEAISGADSVWLEPLSGRQITDQWITDANYLLSVGSTHRGQAQAFSKNSRTARDYFYNDLIGFSRQDSPAYGMGSYYDGRREYPPIDRFVAANRFFAETSIDPVAIGKDFPDSWTWSIESLQHNFDLLEVRAGTERAVRLINAYGRTLAHGRASQNFEFTHRVAGLVGWSEESVDGLFAQRAQALTCNMQSLRVFARYFSVQFEGIEGIPSVSAIANLMGEHPDKHLIALASGVAKYSRHHIRKATAGMDKQTCRTEAVRLLDSQQAATIVGELAARAHTKLHVVESLRNR